MPATVPAKVDVRVQVIAASATEPAIDPRLESLKPALERLPFKGYRVLHEEGERIADKGLLNFVVRKQRAVELHLHAHNDREAKVTLRTHREGREPVETDLTIRRNRSFLYVLRDGEAGGALLLKIELRY